MPSRSKAWPRAASPRFPSIAENGLVLRRCEKQSKLELAVFAIAPVAQLDRACASEAQGRRFEPARAHHFFVKLKNLVDS